MTLKFCRKCKTLMSPYKDFLRCPKCGFIEYKGILKNREKIKAPEKRGKGAVNDKDVFATYKNKCPKCGYDKAEIIDLGLFVSDEDNIYMLKCGKCGYSERIGEAT